MKRLVFVVILVLVVAVAFGQQMVQISPNYPQKFPRIIGMENSQASVLKMIETEDWAKQNLDKIKNRVDKYIVLAEKQPDWLSSRLQMYWTTHATQVYIKGEVFSHAGGEKAPAPTVRYTGSRATTTIYSRPKLEDIQPYMDDERGLLFHNNSKEGKPLEWAEPSKTGRNIESINREIMGIARDAAFLYWLTNETKYAALARNVFDVYMTGIYYRNVPIDLNNGHQQTLVGLTSFEVIHEDILTELVPLYDFLYADLKTNKSDKMDIYAAAFKKWANNIIDNGVPHNNWNLFQAQYVLNIALMLDDDKNYNDGKGRTYYIDFIMNKSSLRQWSLPKLIDYGFDKKTGIWAECPGYSLTVVGDFANVVNWFDNNLNMDLLAQLPILEKAVAATPQYLFPNGNTVGFGDTHPHRLRTDIFERMIANAQKYGKREQEIYFTKMLKYFEPHYGENLAKKTAKGTVSAFFEDKPLKLDKSIRAGAIEEYISPTFWAPNVSWFVQRNGMDSRNSLMISLNGSEGNHQHANGISMELYGKGYTLAPDAGIGSGYFALDYAEYYGQFPAHNTVCVDGISSYPIMKSNHPFELKSCYPASGIKKGNYEGITFSDVYFREPESCADQTRTNSIVTTSEKSGYYVDVFRSKKAAGGDKMHDYFYHNLGTQMKLTSADDSELDLKSTQELAFAGAHLYAYSYMFNQKSALTNKDVKATFTMPMQNGDDISMTMWMKGEKDRTLFSALSPMCEGLSRMPDMPYNIQENPTLTFVARQSGEAWTRPFVAIYEPVSKDEPSNIRSVSYFDDENAVIDFVGIKVVSNNGRTDYIFSNSSAAQKTRYSSMTSQAAYALISEISNGDCVLFLGNGFSISNKEVKVETKVAGNVVVENKNGRWHYTSNVPVKVRIGNKTYKLPASDYKMISK